MGIFKSFLFCMPFLFMSRNKNCYHLNSLGENRQNCSFVVFVCNCFNFYPISISKNIKTFKNTCKSAWYAYLKYLQNQTHEFETQLTPLQCGKIEHNWNICASNAILNKFGVRNCHEWDVHVSYCRFVSIKCGTSQVGMWI